MPSKVKPLEYESKDRYIRYISINDINESINKEIKLKNYNEKLAKIFTSPVYILALTILILFTLFTATLSILSELGYLNRINCIINVPEAYNYSLDQAKCINPNSRSFINKFEETTRMNSLVKIINGYNAEQNAWPFIVSIRSIVSVSKISDHMCGGALINSQYVITAAHCLAKYKWNQLAVIIGIYNSDEKLDFSNTYYVSSISYHPKYSNSLAANGYDIGMIKLCKPVSLSEKVQVVCLPTRSNINLANKTVTVIGWGSTTSGSSFNVAAKQLQQAEMTIINGYVDCLPYANRSIYSILYCARDMSNWNTAPSRMSNICFGDSGGPMLYKIGQTWYLYGITSFTLANRNQSCNPTSPSFFTSVPNFLDWINENVSNKSSKKKSLYYFPLIVILILQLI